MGFVASAIWEPLETGEIIEENTHRSWNGSDPSRWDLLFTISGEATVSSEYASVEMTAGTLTLCEPAKKRFFKIKDNWHAYWVQTNQEPQVYWEKAARDIWTLKPDEKLFRKLQTDVAEIHSLVYYRFENWYPIARNLLENVFLRGNSCIQQARVDPRLLECAVFLTDHYNIPSMDKLAAQYGMSRTSFFESFKKVFGLTPLEYHETARFRQVTHLLQTGGFRFSEIAERCGFPNIFYLSKRFKKRYGFSMREFQKKIT